MSSTTESPTWQPTSPIKVNTKSVNGVLARYRASKNSSKSTVLEPLQTNGIQQRNFKDGGQGHSNALDVDTVKCFPVLQDVTPGYCKGAHLRCSACTCAFNNNQGTLAGQRTHQALGDGSGMLVQKFPSTARPQARHGLEFAEYSHPQPREEPALYRPSRFLHCFLLLSLLCIIVATNGGFPSISNCRLVRAIVILRALLIRVLRHATHTAKWKVSCCSIRGYCFHVRGDTEMTS